MTIYIILLAFILISYVLINQLRLKPEKKRIYFLNVAFIALFLLCALRDPSVGRDVPGYESAYEMTKAVSWDNYRYIYFENGYIFLMKLCIAVGMSFQGFLTLVYFIILTPIYVLIRLYSKDGLMSVLVYICYVLFEFELTGIRQALSMSMCLLAFIVMTQCKRHPIIKSIPFVMIAILFHNGAYAFVLAYAIIFISRVDIFAYLSAIVAVILFFIRTPLLSFIKDYFSRNTMNANAGLYIGLNFIFTVALAIFFVFTEITLKKNDNNLMMNGSKHELKSNAYSIKIFIVGILLMILFGSDTSARSYMNLSQIIIITLPNSINRWDSKTRVVMNVVIGLFLIVFFFTNTLIPNNFDIVPYRFFWQNP